MLIVIEYINLIKPRFDATIAKMVCQKNGLYLHQKGKKMWLNKAINKLITGITTISDL